MLSCLTDQRQCVQNKVFKFLKIQSFESPGAGLQYEPFVRGKGHQLISSFI